MGTPKPLHWRHSRNNGWAKAAQRPADPFGDSAARCCLRWRRHGLAGECSDRLLRGAEILSRTFFPPISERKLRDVKAALGNGRGIDLAPEWHQPAAVEAPKSCQGCPARLPAAW